LNTSDEIIIKLSDPLGINLTKELGHSIIVNNLNNNESFDMTDQFFYDLNSITQGEIVFDQVVNNDNIFLRVTAWDNANNPSEAQIKLNLSLDNNLKLYNVFNFPNPFSKSTKFTFELSSAAKISIYIYTLGGKKIKKIEERILASGYHSIDWDGKNQFGSKIANGVYLYKIIAEDNENKISLISRLAKVK